MRDRNLFVIGLIGWMFILSACSRDTVKRPPVSGQGVQPAESLSCPELPPPGGIVYESWHSDEGLLHVMRRGIDIDVGAPSSQKYVARRGVSPWLESEYISSELAAEDEIGWAAGRYVRWLTGTQATFHFPFYPDEWQGDIYVELGLRPKMNPSMAVRFYKPDGLGGRVWSDPLTTDLTPGWHGYRWRVPREWLNKDGMQIMRASFPGSYFEGADRVSAKFVQMSVGLSRENAPVTGKALPMQARSRSEMGTERPSRVLDHVENAYHLHAGERLDRFMVVPDGGFLSFRTAPGAWLEQPGVFRVDIQTDSGKKTAAEIPIKPGDCREAHTVDLGDYARQAVRISLHFDGSRVSDGFSEPAGDHAALYLSSPEIRVPDTGLAHAHDVFSGAKRIVVIAIDNLRADRLMNSEKRRAVPNLSRFADAGLAGVVMGESRSFVAMSASFLTGVSSEVHGVTKPGVHLRTGLTTIAEAASAQTWKTAFYSTSAILTSAHGFAQGFDRVEQLNRENILSSEDALSRVSSSMAASPEHSLYYVHLSELRLPYRGDEEKFRTWAVPGYAGPVDEKAMQNITVMTNPGTDDGRQLEAYYDAELSRVDAAVGEFVRSCGSDTLVVVYGTHGNSLGESTLGYEQSLSPWELLTPYFFYMNGAGISARRHGIVRADELSASVLDLIGANYPAGVKTIFEPHDSRPRADDGGMTATASENYFYRIRREGVETLYSTGIESGMALRHDKRLPVIYRSMRERID